MSTVTADLAEAARARTGTAATVRARYEWLWIALLALTAVAPYLSTLRYGFVYDDRPQIVENHELLSLAGIPRFFGESISKGVGFQNAAQPVFYRPLFFTQLCLTRGLFGPGPLGFHLVSLLLQVGNTLLLFFTAIWLGVSRRAAYLAGMLFAVHPVHVESVAWASASPDLMALAGVLGSLLTLLIGEASARNAVRLSWKTVSVFSFLAALFVKETALVTLPLIAVVGLFRMRARTSTLRNAAAEIAAYLGAAVFYLAARIHVLHGAVSTVTRTSWLDMARTWPTVLWFYERHLILPMHTSLLYDYDLVEHANWTAFWMPLAAVLATFAALAILLCRYRTPATLISVLLIVLPILLVLNFRVFYWGDLVHDRYLYVPSAGFCILAAMALCEMGRRFESTISPVAQRILAAALVCGMGTMTVAQAQPWKNNLLLLANAAKTAPRNIAAQILLGDELEARNNFPEAKICYERALELTPAWAPAWFAYGRTLLLTHDAEAAVQSLQRAIVLGDSPIIRVWLAVAFEATGRHAEAQSALTVAVAKDPGTLQAFADVRKRLQSSPAK